MRLFVGIGLPKEIKDELFNVQKEFPASLAKIKWIAKGNLHLTLKFLGEVKQEDVGKINERLERIKFEPFMVGLSKIGVFPNLQNIKVLWVGLLPEKKVIELQQKVDGELLDIFKFDQRFSPHLTLGRIKFIKKKDKFISQLRNLSINCRNFEINKFSLVRSILNKDGPVYEELASFGAKDNI